MHVEGKSNFVEPIRDLLEVFFRLSVEESVMIFLQRWNVNQVKNISFS